MANIIANQTWKSYGGVTNFEKTNNITVNNLTTNFFTMRNAYFGNFDICGSIHISNDANVDKNVVVKGSVDISNGLIVDKNTALNSTVNILGITTMQNNLNVLNGSVNIYNELFLGNTLQNPLQNYLYGTNTGIGINTHVPIATLDISGSGPNILNVYSSAPVNTNIIARNQTQNGIVVSANDSPTPAATAET